MCSSDLAEAARLESLRMVLMDFTAGVRWRPWSTPSRYLTAGEVVSASEWNEALGHFSKRRFDFVMLDVDLPGSPDPRQALDALRALDPEVRVILTSRRYLDGLAREAAELAWGHLLKPYTVENLTVMIARQLVAAS